MRKGVVLFLGCVLIVSFWYGEKTKRIVQYSKVFYKMGVECKNRCGQDNQLEYFKKAIYYNPSLSGAYYQIALIYERMGDDAKSLEYFRRVAELDHENVLAAYHVGRQHFREGSYEHSLKYFLRCYKHRPCPDDVQYYLARIYDQKKEYFQAAHHYRNIAVLRDDYAAEAHSRWIEIAPLYNFADGQSFSKEMLRLREMSRHDLADQLEKTVKAAQASEASRGE